MFKIVRGRTIFVGPAYEPGCAWKVNTVRIGSFEGGLARWDHLGVGVSSCSAPCRDTRFLHFIQYTIPAVIIVKSSFSYLSSGQRAQRGRRQGSLLSELEILSVPKFTADLYCICLSIYLRYT